MRDRDNVIYTAQHGWQATGVDFVARAIDMARSKAASAEAASARARFLVGDLTRLPELDVGAGHQLMSAAFTASPPSAEMRMREARLRSPQLVRPCSSSA